MFNQLLRVLKQYLFLAIGVVFGLAICTLLTFWLSTLRVHQLFTEHAPNRAYVSVECIHCQKALAAIAQHPGSNKIVVIPVDAIQSPERDRLCADAIRAIRDEGGLRLSLLSESNLCGRLVKEARTWLERPDTVAVPSWVIGGQLLTPGWSEENIAVLQREGILARDLEIP